MARVIPSGIQDETGRNARQNAANAAALLRLYMSLQARREEQERNEQMRLQMLGLQQQHAIGMQERSQQHAYDLEDYRYGGGRSGASGPNLLGPGAQGLPAPAPAAPTTAAPAARPPVFNPGMIPGSVAPLTPGDQFKGATQQPTIGPNPDKFSALDTEAFSAQSKPTAPAPTKNQMNVKSPLPKETARRTRTRPQQDAYLPIDPQWLGYMSQKEKEYGLPQGMLITLYGMENGGGRVTGKNPKSSATGLFQFTADLRKEHGISDQDTLSPAIMIDRAAANLQRNHEVLKSKFGVSLPTTPEAIPVWSILHLFGAGNGPRIVKALADGHDTPMMQVILPSKNNYQTLVNNGIDPMTSVKNFVGQHADKARRWFHGSIQQFQNPDRDVQQQQEPQPAPVGGVSMQGVNPRLVAAVQGGAQLALPQGYTLRATSGHRPHGDPRSHHARGNAGDWQIYTPDGKPIPNRGADTTGMYTRLARGVKTWALENDPQLASRIGYGGAFGTQLDGGGVPDLMHFDLGGSRGRMRPDVQFARLPPLRDDERTQAIPASVQSRAQAPAPAPTPQPQAPDASVQAATLPSRGGKWIGGKAPYDIPQQPSIAPLDLFSPTLAAQQSFTKPEQQQPPTPITPQSSTLSARSDLGYGAQPATADVPASIEPQRSTLSARSDLDYGAQAPEQVPLPPSRPTDIPQQRQPPPSEDYDLRDDMQTEFTVSSREGSPQVDAAVDQALADLRGDINTRNFPTLPTPGVVAKQDLPPELTPPPRPIEWPQQQAAPSAVARAPVPQEFATVDRGQRPVAPSAQDVSATAEPVAPIRVPGQSIVNAIYSRLPNLSVAGQQGDKGTPPQLPNMPQPSELMPSLPPIPPGLSLEGVGEWLKQNFGPSGAPPAQQEFNTKLQGAVQQKFGDIRSAVGGFDPMAFIERLRYGPKSVKTTTIGTPQQSVKPRMQERMMPGGTPYMPDQPPLTLVPKKGGPTNTTLSGGGSSAGAVPLPGGSGGTMVKMPDGKIMERRVINGVPQFVVPNAPEEVAAEQ